MKRFGLERIWIFAVIWIAIAAVIAPEIASIPARAAENPAASSTRLEVATFAGGCFWCMVPPFAKLEGVVSVTSGYTGGHVKNPTYEQVSAGGTGHAEAVQMMYDPQKVSYEKLLEVFWHNIDPTALDYQFCDHGHQYRSGIFYHTEAQKRLAEQSKSDIEKSKPFKEPIVTEITQASAFYKAEEYHQDFYQKNPIRYKYYRYHCGRDGRLQELWGKAQTGH
ncbi:MAG TPA: peptide-methionine (S)-S-oxide reductase MsrA [Nitrospiria bacterium]|jgi:peptide-methionine (S)-S-oxide reductase|nr:peptide-methionine (S)-S-oxide reductase MsrA [Nitrospiria bacterium]